MNFESQSFIKTTTYIIYIFIFMIILQKNRKSKNNENCDRPKKYGAHLHAWQTSKKYDRSIQQYHLQI